MVRAGRILVTLGAVVLCLTPPALSAGTGSSGFGAGRDRYAFGNDVVIRFVNRADRPVRMDDEWHITRKATGESVALYVWGPEEVVVDPGEDRAWRWDQRDGACYGICQNVHEGEPATAGRYVVSADIDGRRRRDSFDLGTYFTLGFELEDEEDLSFVVYVAEQDDVDQMRAEAATDDDQRMIVSGVVRRGKGYNPEWSYIMGPHSIELGEVFVEVCDAHPEYVERHRKRWLGEVWCPWSSYVDHEGRK